MFNFSKSNKEVILETGQDIADDVKNAASDLKDVGEKAKDEAVASARYLKDRLSPLFDKAKDTVADLGCDVRGRVSTAAGCTSDFVRANPWKSIGIVAALALVAGALSNRRAS